MSVMIPEQKYDECLRCISVKGILSSPVSVTFSCTDSNFYRQVKHIYKMLYNSYTTCMLVLELFRKLAKLNSKLTLCSDF